MMNKELKEIYDTLLSGKGYLRHILVAGGKVYLYIKIVHRWPTEIMATLTSNNEDNRLATITSLGYPPSDETYFY